MTGLGAATAGPVTTSRLAGPLPSLLGTGVLVLAAVGAIGLPEGLGSPAAAAGTASASTGTGVAAQAGLVTSIDLDRRERALSRDSQREAVSDAADAKLQAATEKAARKRDSALDQIEASAEKEAVRLAAKQWQLPVAAGQYRLTSRFGECSGLWSNCHTGLDFAAPSGTPIRASAAGTVTETGYAGAYGQRTIVRLGDGTQMWYCHQTTMLVSPGDTVAAGQVIGSVGSTGNVTGPHLHFEVRAGKDKPVDPAAALAAHGLRL